MNILFFAGAPNPYVEILKTLTFDCVVGVDAGALRLKELGYAIDFAIGDFDSEKPVNAKKTIVLPAEKDDTDLHYALDYVLNQFSDTDIEKIYIIGGLGSGRIDHLVANLYIAHQPRFQKWLDRMLFFEKNNTVCFKYPGKYTIEKESDKFYLSLIGMTPITNLTILKAKYLLKQYEMVYPMALISNEFMNGDAQFSFESGLMCVMQTTDRHQR